MLICLKEEDWEVVKVGVFPHVVHSGEASQKSEEPVSRTTRKFLGGVPTLTCAT